MNSSDASSAQPPIGIEDLAEGNHSATFRMSRSLALASSFDHLNCFIEVFERQALALAATADRLSVDAKTQLPLFGVPFVVKDIFRIGERCPTGGSKFQSLMADRPPSPVIEKILQLGAGLVGATNLDEFCYGMTGLNAHFGAVRNPRDSDRISGGSSSGAAAAVAAGIVPFAIGSDTGGSIRVPAAMCGIVGFKPTLGTFSTEGTIPLSSTQDCIGLLATNVRNVARLMELLNSDQALCRGGRIDLALESITIGLIAHPFFDTTDPMLRATYSKTLDELTGAGLRFVNINNSALNQYDEDAATITGFEAAAYHREHLETHADRFSAAFRLRIERARCVQRNQYDLALIRHQMVFRHPPWSDRCDFLMMPTTTAQPPLITALNEDPQSATDYTLSALRSTRSFSFLGGPAISVPVMDPAGQWWGMQLVARPGDDDRLLELAIAIEDIIR